MQIDGNSFFDSVESEINWIILPENISYLLSKEGVNKINGKIQFKCDAHINKNFRIAGMYCLTSNFVKYSPVINRIYRL